LSPFRRRLDATIQLAMFVLGYLFVLTRQPFLHVLANNAMFAPAMLGHVLIVHQRAAFRATGHITDDNCRRAVRGMAMGLHGFICSEGFAALRTGLWALFGCAFSAGGMTRHAVLFTARHMAAGNRSGWSWHIYRPDNKIITIHATNAE